MYNNVLLGHFFAPGRFLKFSGLFAPETAGVFCRRHSSVVHRFKRRCNLTQTVHQHSVTNIPLLKCMRKKVHLQNCIIQPHIPVTLFAYNYC